jgi:hypothetical protein
MGCGSQGMSRRRDTTPSCFYPCHGKEPLTEKPGNLSLLSQPIFATVKRKKRVLTTSWEGKCLQVGKARTLCAFSWAEKGTEYPGMFLEGSSKITWPCGLGWQIRNQRPRVQWLFKVTWLAVGSQGVKAPSEEILELRHSWAASGPRLQPNSASM